MLDCHPQTESIRDLSELSLDRLTERAARFLERNDPVGAYPYLEVLAKLEGAGLMTITTAGVVAASLKRYDVASEHFERAVERYPDDSDARRNLALLRVEQNRVEDAVDILSELAEIAPNNSAVLNDLGVLLYQLGRTAEVAEAYRQALRVNPDDALARQNLDEIETDDAPDPEVIVKSANEVTGKKIAFFANQPSLLKGIPEHLGNTNEVAFIQRPNVQQIAEKLRRADLILFEWSDELLIHASHMDKGCPVVCRLHSYEAFAEMASEVNWNWVDHLLFVNDPVRHLFDQQVQHPISRSVIHSGVDFQHFTISEQTEWTFKTGSVANIDYQKNPTLLLYCFKKIHEYDSSYRLHLAGQFQDHRYQLYFDHLLNKSPLPVAFDGWIEDMPAWHADKDFVISTSLFDSFLCSIAEGMASGVLPRIHDCYGAENLYPRNYIFSDPDNRLELVTRLEQGEWCRMQQENREYIAERYDDADRCRDIGQPLQSILDKSTYQPGALL